MRKFIIALLIISCVISNNQVLFGATTTTRVKEINVKNYGAKGDGITDDTLAIQKAIDVASAQKAVVLFPASTKTYKISNHLTLRSNTSLSGYGATIFMPSQSNVSVMLYSHAKNYLSNVTIKGLKLKSINDRVGTGQYEGSKTSYVEGISIWGISGLTIQDVTMENLYMGLKLERSNNELKNENIVVSNLNIYSTRNPLYIAQTNQFKITNSILDGSGGGTKFLHAAYIRGGVSHAYFDNVQFNNAPGGGIHIYNGKPILAVSHNLVFENCRINHTRVGVYIYSGSNEIAFRNLTIKNSGLGFKVNDASDLNINGVTISDAASDQAEKGAFSFTNLSDSLFTDVSIDATGMIGSVFELNETIENVVFSGMHVKNVKNIDLLNSQSKLIRNLIVKDSDFHWHNIINTPIRFTGSGASGTFKNNRFTNDGAIYSGLVSNANGAKIVLESNTYLGFNSLESTSHSNTSNTKIFDDIQNHWARAYIEEMAKENIAVGVTDHLFAPERNITLSAFLEMTYKAIDVYSTKHDNHFDLDDIIKTESVHLNREDMAVIVARAHAAMYDIDLDQYEYVVKFKDAGEISQDKLKYVSYLHEKGIVNGYNNTFKPMKEASRAEALTIIWQMVNK